MEKVADILKQFELIDLAGLERVKLTTRTDTKFAFSADRLPEILKHLGANYKVLSIRGKTEFLYKTIYYDTPDHKMYLMHHNGNLTRHKIRQRTYLENNETFLEIKSKNNKGQTLKNRIKVDLINDALSESENNFIASQTPYNASSLKPMVNINYKRITLVNTGAGEKITIDTDLGFLNNEQRAELAGTAILEVKQTMKAKTHIFSVLKEQGIKPVAISKYCMGVNFLYPQIKKNNFKKKLITLNKIINDRPIGHIAGI